MESFDTHAVRQYTITEAVHYQTNKRENTGTNDPTLFPMKTVCQQLLQLSSFMADVTGAYNRQTMRTPMVEHV